MNVKSMVSILALVLSAALVRAEEPAPGAGRVVATLTLPYATILPGVPFDLVVTLRNVSAKPATVGLIVRLVVSDAGGRSLLALRGGYEGRFNNGQLKPAVYDYVDLAPGESLQTIVHWNQRMPNWSRFSSFSGPGIYDIALELARGVKGTDEDFVNYVGVLRTSTARLTRVAVGEDAQLWERMQEVSRGTWSDDGLKATKEGAALADEIIAHHPDSGYYPYAVFIGRIFNGLFDEGDIQPLLDAAKRFPDSPAYPYLVGAAATAAFVEAGRAAYAKDKEREARFTELAKKLAPDALKTGHLAVRGEMEGRIQRLPENRQKRRNAG